MAILTEVSIQVNPQTWLVLNDESDLTSVPDGVYEFDDSSDRFVVVIGGQAVNWATHKGTAWVQYADALRIRREHFQSCPADSIPFDGRPVPYESEADDYGLPPQF